MVLCRIIWFYGLVTLLAVPFLQCIKIHEYLTDDAIATVFDASPDNIPEYDVVTLRHNLYKRSSTNLRLEFTAFGKKIDAYLQPSEGILAGQNTPVWLASTQPNGTVVYKKMPGDTIGSVVRNFISISDQSTMTAFMPEGEKVSFAGFIDAMKVIPLPEKVQTVVRSRREDESSKPSRTLLGTHYHVIIKSPPSKNQNDMLTQLKEKIDEMSVLNVTNYSKSKRSTKDTVYPSILVCTDFAPSNSTKGYFPYYDEIIYQLAFWNAVDLRFRSVDNPKIRLGIAGIVIALDRAATPFANKYRQGDVISLTEDFARPSRDWFGMSEHSAFPLEAYDIVIVITDNAMTYTYKNGKQISIYGLSAGASLCFHTGDEIFASAIIRDRGGFEGVYGATHELGHIFGLNHDKKSGNDCDQSYHYIMQPEHFLGPKNLEWSPCSHRTLSWFLRLDDINCIDKPAEFYPPGTPVQRFLPGDIATTHKQCQDRGYDWACATTSEICTKMQCYVTGWRALKAGWWCMDEGPAAEGTTCSSGHRCLDGVCQRVSKHCASGNQ